MIAVQFPSPDFRIKKRGEERYIFDAIRKRWVVLTEEEWVRQNFIAFLTVTMQFPVELISVEKEILVNGLKKRFDILVFNKQHQPLLMVECKAPNVPLNEDVLQQVLHYTIAAPVQYIAISNGIHTKVWEKAGEQLVALEQFPSGS